MFGYVYVSIWKQMPDTYTGLCAPAIAASTAVEILLSIMCLKKNVTPLLMFFKGVSSSTTDGEPKDATRSTDDERRLSITATTSVQHATRTDT